MTWRRLLARSTPVYAYLTRSATLNAASIWVEHGALLAEPLAKRCQATYLSERLVSSQP